MARLGTDAMGKYIQIHRFHHRAGMIASGKIVYLTIEEIRQIADVLDRLALDIEAYSFTDSKFCTFRLNVENEQ
jgi:hypothetical protein